MWPTLLPASLGAKPSRCDGGSPSSSQSNSTRQLRAAGFGGVWSGMADDAAWSMLLDGVPKEGMAAESNPRRGQKRAHACRSRAADEWGYDGPPAAGGTNVHDPVAGHDQDRIQSLL